MRWPDALRNWPNAHLSKRVECRPHRWHIQEIGRGPLLLLLHGAGGANHSWRGVLPALANHGFRVVAIDLPGHGLTQLGTRTRSGLSAMSEDVLRLCSHEGWMPAAVVGHSAGGAVALRMAQIDPNLVPRVIGVNAALGNFKGLAGILFPVMAKLLALTPFTADFFSRSARDPSRVEALLAGTGSKLTEADRDLYRALVADTDHVNGALLMMAQWSLNQTIDEMPKMKTDVFFLTGGKDKTVPPVTSQEAAGRISNASWENWPDYGHLMHEEVPEKVAERVTQWLTAQG